MGKTVGTLIKEARLAAGLTQEQLAREVDTVTASAIGKAERGETELSQETLKQIAKATGVTQASLIRAARASAGKSAGKTTGKAAGKTAGKGSGKTSGSTAGNGTGKTARKIGATAAKTTAELKLTATEKTLVQLYRKADSSMKKTVMSLLKGERPETGELLETLVSGAMNMLGNRK